MFERWEELRKVPLTAGAKAAVWLCMNVIVVCVCTAEAELRVVRIVCGQSMPGSEAKPLLAGGTLEGATGFGVPSPTSRAEWTWERQTFL